MTNPANYPLTVEATTAALAAQHDERVQSRATREQRDRTLTTGQRERLPAIYAEVEQWLDAGEDLLGRKLPAELAALDSAMTQTRPGLSITPVDRYSDVVARLVRERVRFRLRQIRLIQQIVQPGNDAYSQPLHASAR